MVVQQIKALLLGVVRLFRRMLCCFSFRKRKPSLAEPVEIRVVVDGKSTFCSGIADVSAYPPPQTHHYQGHQEQQPERDWNSWDDSPRTVSEHIEHYRQRIAKPSTPPPEESEPDFFSELAPVIKPQLKYYLGDDNKESATFSRLETKIDVPIAMHADLEDWVDDSVNGGWEELDAEQTKLMIREKRKELRHQRNQKTARSNGIEAQSLSQGIIGSRHSAALTTPTPPTTFRSCT